MSGEYIYYPERNLESQISNQKIKKVTDTKTEKVSNKKPRVDINNLLNKVSRQNKKQKKENLVFFSVISSVILITGLIVSL